MAWMWLVYALVVLLISGLIGLHLGRFREAYTEMTGMMAGMTMGMLNGFLLGYVAGAYTFSMFLGNLFGILLGLALGAYFGRAGGLMGIMDGAMGGVMGGSMGAMLAVMVAFPPEGIYWTALLLGIIYVVGMVGLVALIEQSAPEHAAMHRVLPMFTCAIAAEVAEDNALNRGGRQSSGLQITDYYTFLGIAQSATSQEIGDAYLTKLASSNEADIERAELALAILTDPRKRQLYDLRLQESRAANDYDQRGDCCPPRKGTRTSTARLASATVATAAPTPARANGNNGKVVTTPVRSRPKGASANSTAPPIPTRKTNTSPKNGSRSSDARFQQVPTHARRVAAPQQKEAPVSWIGMLAAVVLVVMLAGWWLVSQGGSRVATGNGSLADPQLEAQAVVATIAADGRQTLDFVVNGYTQSYEPKAIKVKKGVPVHFDVTLEGPDPG
jgi:hypothetical protein